MIFLTSIKNKGYDIIKKYLIMKYI